MPSEGQELELLQNEAIPLLDHKKKPFRLIYPVNPSSEEIPLLRFGPHYRDSQSSKESEVKERAWNHVLEKSPDTEAMTTENYLSAMRRIEGKAREAYSESTTVDELTGSQFRWMMIKDGCFFLQMMLFILGRAERLDYPSDDEFFGAKRNSKKEWIKSMFFVGNQIPFVVLKELLNQSFFKQVISHGKWNKLPSELSKRVLYEFLVLPAVRKAPTEGVYWVNEGPIDLIHALQLLVLVPGNDGEVEGEAESEDDEDEDLNKRERVTQQMQLVINVHDNKELKDVNVVTQQRQGQVVINIGGTSNDRGYPSAAKPEDENITQQRQGVTGVGGTSSDRTCPSATELKQQGVHFEVCLDRRGKCYHIKKASKAIRYFKIEGVGGPGITFVNGLSAALFLPQLMLDDETELLLGCLKNYELSQPIDQKNRDFSSYLRFMSELIRTPEDANLLHTRGIIQGTRRPGQKLVRILGKLTTKDKYNHNFRALTRKLSDYNRPAWKSFQFYVIFIAFLTLLQAVYAVIGFHVNKK